MPALFKLVDQLVHRVSLSVWHSSDGTIAVEATRMKFTVVLGADQAFEVDEAPPEKHHRDIDQQAIHEGGPAKGGCASLHVAGEDPSASHWRRAYPIDPLAGGSF